MLSSICQQSQSIIPVVQLLVIHRFNTVNAANAETGLNAKPDQLSQTIHSTLARMAYICKQSYIEHKGHSGSFTSVNFGPCFFPPKN